MEQIFDLENHIFRFPAFQKLIQESIAFPEHTPDHLCLRPANLTALV